MRASPPPAHTPAPSHACVRGPLRAVLIVNELRSHSVHAAFMAAFSATHTLRQLSSKLMHDTYQHENIMVGGAVLALVLNVQPASTRAKWQHVGH